MKVFIGEKVIPLSEIGLDNICVKTTEDANILLNTVKQTKICCGKPVEKKANVPMHNNDTFSIVQKETHIIRHI